MRFSTSPSKQILFWLVQRDLRRHAGACGIDAGCGFMASRRYFRTDQYVGIDVDEARVQKGLEAYRYCPETYGLVSTIEDYIGPRGDVVLCCQLLTGRNVEPGKTVDVVSDLIDMTRAGGTLIFNLGRSYVPYARAAMKKLRAGFEKIETTSYGRWSRHYPMPVSLALAAYMYLLWRPGDGMLYFLCQGRLGRRHL